MEHTVDSPGECPFLREDYDGFPDGCKYDETECIYKDEFPDDCPLNNGNIIITKG